MNLDKQNLRYEGNSNNFIKFDNSYKNSMYVIISIYDNI